MPIEAFFYGSNLKGEYKYMKKNLTEMVFILDRSGSMQNLTSDTIGGSIL